MFGSVGSASRVCREAGDEVRHLRADLLGDRVVGVGVALGDRLGDELGDLLISSVPMPWVVTQGVPTRMPLAMLGFCGSNGMAFLLRTMPAASARASASAPVTPTPWRSCRLRWVSVPPVVGRIPFSPSEVASDRGVLDDLLGVVLVLRGRALLEVDRLGRDGVHLRAALHHREDRLVELGGVLLLADERARAGAAQHLVGREA